VCHLLIDRHDFSYLLHQHYRVTSLRSIQFPCISRIDNSENYALRSLTFGLHLLPTPESPECLSHAEVYIDFEIRFSVLIEMFVTPISFRGTFKSFCDLTEVSEQSWYKVLTYELVHPTFKISLLNAVAPGRADFFWREKTLAAYV